MKILHIIAFLLLGVGGLNWGLVGIGGFIGTNLNVVHALLGAWPMLESSVYVLVGLATIVVALTHKGSCKMCSGKQMPMAAGM